MVGYGVGGAAVILDRMTKLMGYGCCVKGWHPTRNHVRPLPQMIPDHFSLLLHKCCREAKRSTLVAPNISPSSDGASLWAERTLGLNSSAQTIIAYFLILGHRANVSVELALPKEAGKRNGED